MTDFLLYDQPVKHEQTHEQTPEQMLATVELLTEAFGGKRVVN